MLMRSSQVGFDLDVVRPIFRDRTDIEKFAEWYRLQAAPTLTYRSIYSARNYRAIGDPMIIASGWDAARESFDIGMLKVGTGAESRWYLFRVDDIFVNTENQTEIAYTIDYAASFPEAVKQGRVIRCPKGQSYARSIPLDPRYWRWTPGEDEYDTVNNGVGVALVLSQMKSSGSSSYDIQGPVYCLMTGVWISMGGGGQLIGSNLIGDMIASGRFTASDIVNAWIVPIFDVTVPRYWQTLSSVPTHVQTFAYTTSTQLASWDADMTLSAPIPNTDTASGVISGICDERGNVLHTFTDHVDVGSKVYARYNLSMSGCEVDITFGDRGFINGHLTDVFFTYSCRPIDVICDSWQDYLVRQRDADIANRRIQNESSLVGGVGNTLTGALTGALTGSAIPGIGTLAGAVVGASAGLLTSGLQYGLSTYYGSMEQDIVDAAYKLRQDTVAVNGMQTGFLIASGEAINMFTIHCDAQYLTEVGDMLDLVGVPTDAYSTTLFDDIRNSAEICTSPDGHSYVSVMGTPWAVVPEISDVMPTRWKRTITETYARGARFVKLEGF